MAFRGKNLRSGDLAEQLGVLLLQNVALISQIHRTEDVGIDVIATLIRDFDKYRYIAEDSFFVQIKSSSVTEITFKNEQVKWLAELQLPFFIASVDRKTSTVYLYNTHYLSDALMMNPNRKEIILELNNISDFDCSGTTSSINVPLGPCIISWSLENCENDKKFIKEFYQLLKPHILIAKKSIETRRVGVIDLIKWKTGGKPEVIGTKLKPGKSTLESDKIIDPYFNALLQKLLRGEHLFTTRSLYCLLEKILEQKGHLIIEDGKKVLIPFSADLNEAKND